MAVLKKYKILLAKMILKPSNLRHGWHTDFELIVHNLPVMLLKWLDDVANVVKYQFD